MHSSLTLELPSRRARPPSGNELRYYFTVNSRYVRNKLRLLFFPFSFRGPWHRAVDQQVRVCDI